MLGRFGSSRSLVAALFSAALAACSTEVEGDADDDVDTSEEAVSAPRAIGLTMPATRLLAARSFAARPPARLRSDVVVGAPAGMDRTPREVRRATSRAFTWDGETRVVLAASAAGDASIVADDFVLVEVLDAATGALIATRTIGAAFDVTLGGARVPSAPGLGEGVEITQALPPSRPFRLRVSGLDIGGQASVTDVFLAALALPEDPFADGFCAGPRMTREQGLAYIAPGAQFGAEIPQTDSNVLTQVRACGPTGCGDWRTADPGEDALLGEVSSSSLGHTWTTRVGFKAQDLRGRIEAFADDSGVRLHAKRPYDVSISYPSTGRFAWMQGVSFGADARYGGGSASASVGSARVRGETELRVGKDCYQLRNLRKEPYREILTVAYGRFAPPR